MFVIPGSGQSPTVQDLIEGRYSGENGSVLTAQGGKVKIADGRVDPAVAWRLSAKLSEFQSDASVLAAQATMQLQLTNDEEVLPPSPNILAGSDQFVTVATRPPGAGRAVDYNVQGQLALAPLANPVAGHYSATVLWELTQGPDLTQ